jgi:glycosyltransferase involved in cell wall biosynthesis
MTEPRLLIAHPSPDLYGSDRQLVETVLAARADGWSVLVVLPLHGPLEELLEEAGARVDVVPFPVLRKSLLGPVALVGFAVRLLTSTLRLAVRVRRARPNLVLVNTVTIPGWLAAARLARVRVLCHVHEAEESQPRPVRTVLAAPLLLAQHVVTNSEAARGAIVGVVPGLSGRTVVVHNGVAGPAEPPVRHSGRSAAPVRLALVGRLSPRKGTDTAVEALELLVRQGRDVELALCGAVFPGYEWFETELRDRASTKELQGRVLFRGYVHPTWPELADADVVLVPSRHEPFGNTAVEGMLARRPVIASRVQGLAEVLTDDVTGLLVDPDDPVALASAVARVLDDRTLADRLADDGFAEAHRRFTVERYRSDMAAELVRAASYPA